MDTWSINKAYSQVEYLFNLTHCKDEFIRINSGVNSSYVFTENRRYKYSLGPIENIKECPVCGKSVPEHIITQIKLMLL